MSSSSPPEGRFLDYLAMVAFVHCRDEDAVMGLFRVLATTLEEAEAMRIYRLAEKTMTGADRLWISRISGREPEIGTMMEASGPI
jgi:hypothetical protein